MTPKEKANELIDKFQQLGIRITLPYAKQCAIIAVDEILMLAPAVSLSDSMYDYLGEVKQEIEKL